MTAIARILFIHPHRISPPPPPEPACDHDMNCLITVTSYDATSPFLPLATPLCPALTSLLPSSPLPTGHRCESMPSPRSGRSSVTPCLPACISAWSALLAFVGQGIGGWKRVDWCGEGGPHDAPVAIRMLPRLHPTPAVDRPRPHSLHPPAPPPRDAEASSARWASET